MRNSLRTRIFGKFSQADAEVIEGAHDCLTPLADPADLADRVMATECYVLRWLDGADVPSPHRETSLLQMRALASIVSSFIGTFFATSASPTGSR